MELSSSALMRDFSRLTLQRTYSHSSPPEFFHENCDSTDTTDTVFSKSMSCPNLVEIPFYKEHEVQIAALCKNIYTEIDLHLLDLTSEKSLEKIVSVALSALSRKHPENNSYTQDIRYEYIKKSKKGAARTVIVDHEQKMFFILLKSKGSSKAIRGSSKRGSPAICVSEPSCKVELVWQLVTLDERCANTFTSPLIEKQVCNSCSPHPNLPRILGALTYTKIKKIKTNKNKKITLTFQKECYFYPYINTTLEHYRTKDSIKDYREISTLVLGAASALHKLFIKGWVHFDVKPDNILLDLIDLFDSSSFGSYRPVLIDFGFSDLQERIQAGARFYGTTSFTPPEMLRRNLQYPQLMYRHHKQNTIKPALLDLEKIDVYALGCVLHLLLIGDLPWENKLYWFADSLSRQVFSNEVHQKMSQITDAIIQMQEEEISKFGIRKESYEYLKNKPADFDKQFLYHLCNTMLDPDPLMRPCLKKILIWFSGHPNSKSSGIGFFDN